MSSSSLPNPAVTRYQKLIDESQVRLRTCEQTWRRFIALRSILFLTAAGALGPFFLRFTKSYSFLAIGIVFAIAFLFVAYYHEVLNFRLQRHRIECRLYQRLLARLNRDWEKLPEVDLPDLEQSALDTSEDLDLIKGRSLIRWASLTGTMTGLKVLAKQLTTFADAETLRKRQEAVQEILPLADMRRKLLLQLWNLGSAPGSIEDFVAWVEQPFQQPIWVQRLSVVGPVFLLLGVLILAIDTASVGFLFFVGVTLMLLGGLVNISLVLGFVGTIHNVFKSIGTHKDLESICHDCLATLGAMAPKSELLQELHATLSDPSNRGSALVGLERLRWPMSLAGVRLQPLLYLPFLVLQCCVLWDFRIINWLDQWRLNYLTDVRRWLEGIGKLEAILSASSIAEEYPNWTFPSVDMPEDVLIQATAIGHPLLRDDSRVLNDLTIQSACPLLLVTGSNMAGKSTLMRTLGVNVALSRTGAPVCATSLACEPLELATSIRVRDSLADGVSFFMAELLRLRKVVDFVDVNRTQLNHRSLVILDEILQGTNSQERQIAVSHVIQKLLKFKPLLMVSTHDLQLANTDGFSDNSQIIHFREHFVDVNGKPEMRFDYRVHPGVAPTTNALKLLELVGLD